MEIFSAINEVINYSFIPIDTMNIFNINKSHRLYSDLIIQNPVSPSYALMRPTLAYSLINSLIYNYSRNNTNLSLFELGRTYFKDDKSDTGCREENSLGLIITGSRLEKGWEIDKEIKYNYYDILNYINILFDQFGQKFELIESDYGFCEP